MLRFLWIFWFVFFQFKGEDFVERYLESMGDAKSQFEAGKILAMFDGYNGLPRNAGSVGQFLLGHFAGKEPERTDVVGNVCFGHFTLLSGRNTGGQFH